MTGCNPGDGAIRVELYTRGTVPAAAKARQDETIARLRAAADEGAFDLEVSRWPKRIPMDAGAATDALEEAITAFRAWASATGQSLEPALSTRVCYSWATAEQYTALVLPVMLLAVYEDDELVGVFPHLDDGEVHTVVEAVDELTSQDTGPGAGTGRPLATSD